MAFPAILSGFLTRRQPQPTEYSAAEGQGWQSLERFLRGRIPRMPWLARRRGRPGHPRNSEPRTSDAPRFRRRLGRADAPGADARAEPHAVAQGLRFVARRSADDDK